MIKGRLKAPVCPHCSGGVQVPRQSKAISLLSSLHLTKQEPRNPQQLLERVLDSTLGHHRKTSYTVLEKANFFTFIDSARRITDRDLKWFKSSKNKFSEKL